MINYQVREYQKTDWPLVSAWWAARGNGQMLIEGAIPPVGVVVESDGEPVAAMWAHLSAGVGVAFIEYTCTKPGLNGVAASKAVGLALEAIEAVCRAHDYGLLVAYTAEKSARWLERRKGFTRTSEVVHLAKLLT